MDEQDCKEMNRQEKLDNVKLNLIRTADFKDISNLWLTDQITTSRAAEMLNDRANEALRKLKT